MKIPARVLARSIAAATMFTSALNAGPIVDTADSGPSVAITIPSFGPPHVTTGAGGSILGSAGSRQFTFLTLDNGTHPFSVTAAFANSEMKVTAGPGQAFDLNMLGTNPNPYFIQSTDRYLAVEFGDVQVSRGGFSMRLQVLNPVFGLVLSGQLENPSPIPTWGPGTFYFGVPSYLTGLEMYGWNLTAVTLPDPQRETSFILRQAYFTDTIPAPVPEPASWLTIAAGLAVAVWVRTRT